MKAPHWQYFAVLSDELEKTERFVAISEKNYKTYSIEFVRLLLSVGSEIDVVAKLLCKRIDASSAAKQIDSYRKCILREFPDLPDVQVRIIGREIDLLPWTAWRHNANPHWWRSYNNVKHERDRCFSEANLENCLNALAALLILVGYLYADELSKAMLPSHSLLEFDRKHFYCSRWSSRTGNMDGFCLPGVPKPKLSGPGNLSF